MVDIERFNDRGFLSDAVACGDWVWISGTVPDGGSVSLEDQTRNVLLELDRRLELAGSSKDRLLFVSLWLADMADWPVMNQIWIEWLDGASSPARAVVGAALMAPFKIEIAATAVRGMRS